MRRNGVVLAALALAVALIPTTVLAAGPGVTINEIRIDQPGSDTQEYFELTGDPGSSLDGYTYIVIGDGAGGSGVIEEVTDLSGQSIDTDGFFVAAESTFTLGTADLTTGLSFENSDNVTHLLVQGFTGASGDDLDTNDDGTLDVTPWTSIADLIALVEEPNPPSGTEYHYGPPTVGPDGSFVPGQAYDCATDGWTIGVFTPGVSDTPGETNVCDAVVVEPLELKIHEVQGSGDSGPFAGELVTVEGVVVGDFQGNAFAGNQLNGFFVQEESDEWDADPDTSEGVFVYAPGAPEVSVGDVVEVTGTAVEFSGKTQITSVETVEITGSESVALALVSLPISDTSDWEKYEGMLVTFPQDLYISEYFNFDRFGEIVLTTARQYQGTHVTDPGPGAIAVAEANSLARIIVDDGRTNQNPDPAIHPNGEEFTLTNTFRGGDILQDVTGVMDFNFGRYKLQPVHLAEPGPAVTYINANPRPTAPDPIPGEIRVATFNVLNFFTHTDDGDDSRCGPTGFQCRGADNATELQRQLDKLVVGIIALDADIVGIQEIENDIRTDDGDRKHDAVLTLVEALNLVEGAGTWAWVGEANYYNNYPIRNEIIYKPGSVVTVGDPTALADPAFDRVRPDDDNELAIGRPPLAQTFRPLAGKGSSQKFAVVVNHFKSKGSSCSSIGDPNTGDGQANCNLTRVAQSEALLDFVKDLKGGSSGVLVIGDLNSYAMEDPIKTLEAGGLTDLVKLFEGPDAYTFVFDGQLGYLDTALATRSMLNWVAGVTIFHINVDEPDILNYDTSFKKDAQDLLYEVLPYRVSDHDPVIVGLQFGGKKR